MDSPLRIPKAAVQALTGSLIPPESSSGAVIELVIRLDNGALNARGFGAYLALADRVYGRMTEVGLKSYSQAVAGQLEIQEVREGSVELLVAKSVSHPGQARPLAVLWLCLKHLPTWTRLWVEATESRAEEPTSLLISQGSWQEESLAKETRRRFKHELKQDTLVGRLDERRVGQLARLLEDLYTAEYRHLPAASRFARKSVRDVLLLVRSPTTEPRERYPLRGTAIHYADPVMPVAQDDWEAAR